MADILEDLERLIKKTDSGARLGSHKHVKKPWYNPHGNMIQFQTVDEAVVAEYVNTYVSFYRSAIDNRIIGFEIRGVNKILKEGDVK